MLTALLLPATLSAQDAVDRAELARCAALAEAAERLACFESLAGEPPPAEAVPPSQPAEAEQTAAESDAAPAPTSTTVAPVVEVVPDELPAAGDTGGPASPGPEQTEPPSMPPDELGAEHLDREEGEDRRAESVGATVEEVWKGGNRLLYFRFANGQIWRQMESGYFHYPRDSAFEVTIRQGFMGDYQMRRTGSARMTRIVRVK